MKWFDPVAVADEQCDRGASRPAAADARQHLGAIGFNRHAPATSIAALPLPQIVVHGVEVDGKPRGQPFENDNQALAVRFASGQKTKHGERILSELSATLGPPIGRK